MLTYKKIWNIAYPIIIGSIAQNLINVTDTAFLGRVGEIALGAAAIGGIFYIAFAMLGWGFAIGTQIIIARRLGENHADKIGTTFEHALAFLITIALVIFIFLKFISPGLLTHVLESVNIIDASNAYLGIRSFGIFFVFINFAFRAFYIGIAKTKVISLTTIVMAMVNILLDYVLIFGKFGFSEMGIEGAALASVIAEISATGFFIIYTLRRISLKDYQLFYFQKFNLILFKRIITTAFPIMMQNFISLSGWFVFFVLVEHLGETELAISNIIRSIYVVLMIPIWGYASATNTLVSFYIGKNEINNVFATIYKTIILSVGSVLILIFLFITFPEKFLSIYTNNDALILKSLPVFYTISGAALFIAAGFVLFSAVSGTGKTQVSFIIECIIIGLYLSGAYLLTITYESSIQWVWSLEYLYGILLALLSYVYLKYGKWKGHSV